MMHAVFLLFCCGLKGDTTLDRQEHWDRKRGHQEKKKKKAYIKEVLRSLIQVEARIKDNYSDNYVCVC